MTKRKLRRLKDKATNTPDLGAGLTTYSNVTDDELCRLFRTHESPLVEELVARLVQAQVDDEELDRLRTELDDMPDYTDDLTDLAAWGEALEGAITAFIAQEKEAKEDERPTIEDLEAAFENVNKPEIAER